MRATISCFVDMFCGEKKRHISFEGACEDLLFLKAFVNKNSLLMFKMFLETYRVGYSTVAECPPLNWKVACSMQSHWVNPVAFREKKRSP